MNDIYVDDEQELQDLLTKEQERIDCLTHVDEDHEWKPVTAEMAGGVVTCIETISIKGPVLSAEAFLASVECCFPCRILRNRRES